MLIHHVMTFLDAIFPYILGLFLLPLIVKAKIKYESANSTTFAEESIELGTLKVKDEESSNLMQRKDNERRQNSPAEEKSKKDKTSKKQ